MGLFDFLTESYNRPKYDTLPQKSVDPTFEQLMQEAAKTGDYSKVAQAEALKDAYNPAEAPAFGLMGMMTAPVKSAARFGVETIADPISEGLMGMISQASGADQAGMRRFNDWKKKAVRSGSEIPQQIGDLYSRFSGDVDKFPVGQKGATPLRSNTDYRQSFDLDTVCPRNKNCDELISQTAEKIGRPLYSDEAFKAVEFLQQKDIKAPCLYCYVDTPRRAWMDGKLKLSDEMGLDRRVWSDPEFLKQAEAADPSLPQKMADISKQSRPMMANTRKPYAEYTGQFLNLKQKDVDFYNSRAGFRMNSSTDFKPEHTMDFIQAIQDANTKGLQLHAYTKEPDFVDLFGDTGIKINTSIAATGGNGKPIKMDAKNGMDWDTAKALRERHPDVGTIIVVNNEDQLRWALDEPWVDYVIPYHASGQKKTQQAAFGAEDFTKTQNPRSKKTGKPVKGFYRDKHMNDLNTALKYVDEHNIEPQFSAYRNDPNYMKLIVDYSRFDTPHSVPDPNKINFEKADQIMSKYVDVEKDNPITGDLVNEFSGLLGEF